MKEKQQYLHRVQVPEDVKKIKRDGLETLCAEIRAELLSSVSETGGHLSSNLGVVELTVALLRAFDLSTDAVVWDVGHQCYPFKMLTGRKDSLRQIRQMGGISGFPNPKESPYDAFVVGHSSTSVSAANGIAKAKTLRGEDGYTVAVIGDGAMTGGLAYEGLSNAGRSDDRLIVVLNDNQMSISPNVGFAARHLSSLRARPRYVRLKLRVTEGCKHIPLIGKSIYKLLLRSKNTMKRLLFKDVSFFEDMGFYYIGPINGHNLDQLNRAFEAAKMLTRPVVVHVETVKGKGYTFAEKDPGNYHGVSRFDPSQKLAPSTARTFSSVFGETLDAMAQKDERVVAITAAMKHGTGMMRFAEHMPSRCFDTGIAEAHAVTFASGLAGGGMLPIFAVYATFLQRAYDQLLNDTSIMDNHIVLCIDRAGIVPEDGETHQGIYDIPFLTTIPHTTIFAPATLSELPLLLKQAAYDTDGIAAVRYPRGGEPLSLHNYTPDGAPIFLEETEHADTLVVTYGRVYGNVLTAAQQCAQNGKPVSVLKMAKIFPLEQAVVQTAMRYTRVVFVEEAAKRGGIGEYLAARLLENGFKGQYIVRAIEQNLPPCTLEQGMYLTGLDAQSLQKLFANEEN